MKHTILCLLITITLCNAIQSSFDYTDMVHLKNFKDFTRTYNKVYNDAERMVRFQIFKDNMIKVEEMNARSDNEVFGVTQFSDLSEAEFKELYLNSKISAKEITYENVIRPTVDAVPAAFDWREKGAVTAVKNQGQCGSCWAFSTTENIESVWIIAQNISNNLDLSEQQIVDCDTNDDGCEGGDTTTGFEYVISAGGLESEAAYPYTATDGTCKFSPKKVVAKISNWKYATMNQDEQLMQQNLVSWAPLSICVDAAAWQFYSGGVMTPKDCGRDLDHCVQVVGYKTGSNKNEDYWIVRNSWGPTWGLDGYIHLQMWHDTCGVAMEANTAVV